MQVFASFAVSFSRSTSNTSRLITHSDLDGILKELYCLFIPKKMASKTTHDTQFPDANSDWILNSLYSAGYTCQSCLKWTNTSSVSRFSNDDLQLIYAYSSNYILSFSKTSFCYLWHREKELSLLESTALSVQKQRLRWEEA